MNNIFPYKLRQINPLQPVWIYRNLHSKGQLHLYSIMQKTERYFYKPIINNGYISLAPLSISIKNKKSKLVIAHTNQIMLRDCEFIVNECGRNRVLKTNSKNVHAFIKGYITDSGMGVDASGSLPARILYNPYNTNTFLCENLTAIPFPVYKARTVILNQRGCFGTYLN